MTDERMTELDSSVSHSARIWNHWLGGKDNFEIDRRTGDQIPESIDPGEPRDMDEYCAVGRKP